MSEPVAPIRLTAAAVSITLPGGLSLQDAGVVLGWLTAFSVYLALAHLAFLHRWQPGSAARGAGVTAYG